MNAGRDPQPSLPSWWRTASAIASFGLGVFIIVFELLTGRGVPERPYMMAVAAALLGLPVVAAQIRGRDK